MSTLWHNVVLLALLCVILGHGQVQELTREPSCMYHEFCLKLLDDVKLHRALCNYDDADLECVSKDHDTKKYAHCI